VNYEAFFRTQLDRLRREGNYRVFADLERHAGAFPRATHYSAGERREVTVWCANDYHGMGQHPTVIAAMHAALDRCGAGGTATFPAPTAITCSLNANWPCRNLLPKVTLRKASRFKALWVRNALKY
jgi:7-keto-8-aminopelargonate synthetase-like enzyme